MRIYDISIKPALNGWVVKVGCQTIVYVDKPRLLTDLDQYLANPEAKEKEFVAGAVNKRLLDGPCIDGRPGVEPCIPPQGLECADARHPR